MAGLEDPVDGLGRVVRGVDQFVGKVGEGRAGAVGVGQGAQFGEEEEVLGVEVRGPFQERVPGATVGDRSVELLVQADEGGQRVEQDGGGQ